MFQRMQTKINGSETDLNETFSYNQKAPLNQEEVGIEYRNPHEHIAHARKMKN
jgi:hypothetical protein